MLKVVLIDDARIVIRGIVSIIDWENEELELAGTAGDGVAGLELLREKRPDIVITDIRMPGCSGLEMIQQAQEFLKQTVYVIISGYNDFRYVRQAISLGVVDYLEKPITVEKIKEAMGKAIEESVKRRAYTRLIQNTKELRAIVPEYLLRRYLLTGMISAEEFQQKLENLNPPVAAERVMAVCVYFENTVFLDREWEMLREKLWEEYRSEAIHFIDGRYHYLLFFMREQCGEDQIMQILFELEGLHPDCRMGIGNAYGALAEMKTSFTEAETAIQYAAFFDRGPLLHINSVRETQVITRNHLLNQDKLILDIRTGKSKEVKESVLTYLQQLLEKRLSPELFRHECLNIVYLFLNLDSELGKFQNDSLPYREIENMNRGEDILVWMETFVDDFFVWMKKQNDVHGNHTIQKVVQYINEHYGENLSLDVLAELVKVNSTYLSILFKKEMNVTYLKYLTSVRMEHAKQFLKQGEKAKDVCAKVGYYDYRHFSSTFKKYTGMSPEQFKAN